MADTVVSQKAQEWWNLEGRKLYGSDAGEKPYLRAKIRTWLRDKGMSDTGGPIPIEQIYAYHKAQVGRAQGYRPGEIVAARKVEPGWEKLPAVPFTKPSLKKRDEMSPNLLKLLGTVRELAEEYPGYRIAGAELAYRAGLDKVSAAVAALVKRGYLKKLSKGWYQLPYPKVSQSDVNGQVETDRPADSTGRSG